MKQTGAKTTGFTLIELLIVIAILGTLMVALLPNIVSAGVEGEIADTRARIHYLVQAAKEFERSDNGYYPPDNFKGFDGKALAKDNGVNSGIESLVVFLCQKRLSSDTLAGHEDWLQNTDGDQGAAEIPVLERRDLMEVVDAWGTPMVYFASIGGGYGHVQRVETPEGDTVRVKALINPRTNRPAAKTSFQLISAGPDMVFATDDDITHPVLVEDGE